MDVHELIRVFLKEENRKELSLYACYSDVYGKLGMGWDNRTLEHIIRQFDPVHTRKWLLYRHCGPTENVQNRLCHQY